jgi:hypothetical protein
MKIEFRTYNNFQSTIFDLINGNKETKQTLALGYLLSNDLKFLKSFLNLKTIKENFGISKLDKFSKIIVSTEVISENNKRIDVAISFFLNNLPYKTLVIEAKSIKINVSVKEIKKQIGNYIEKENFPSLKGFKLTGCVLTKNKLVINSGNLISISWDEIIELLSKQEGLAKDYLTFLSNINGTMKFYEKEVYSIPAGDSYKYQYNYPHIYECPNTSRYIPKKKPLYVTFRMKEGIMEKLFGIEDIIVFNPFLDFDTFMINPKYSDETKKRVKEYCDDFWGEGNYDDNEKQFFILSLENKIELRHKPRPRKNNVARIYYTLAEILNGKKYIEKDYK